MSPFDSVCLHSLLSQDEMRGTMILIYGKSRFMIQRQCIIFLAIDYIRVNNKSVLLFCTHISQFIADDLVVYIAGDFKNIVYYLIIVFNNLHILGPIPVACI